VQRRAERPRGPPAAHREETQQLLYRILSTEQQKRLEVERQIDLSYSVSGVARFRVNVFFQRSAVGAVFRLIPYKILTLEELRLPAGLHEMAERPRGLVLVTGPTGRGSRRRSRR
jgi:twitching motility protein PilT